MKMLNLVRGSLRAGSEDVIYAKVRDGKKKRIEAWIALFPSSFVSQFSLTMPFSSLRGLRVLPFWR
jgi:hypothetical protein